MPSRKQQSAPWPIVYFLRHKDDDTSQAQPGRDFLKNECPSKIKGEFIALIDTVAAYPPPSFPQSRFWRIMTKQMSGYCEAKIDGQEAGQRLHYRLFCFLEHEGPGVDGPKLVVITGKKKPYLTVLSQAEYDQVKALGDEYLSRVPRSVVR